MHTKLLVGFICLFCLIFCLGIGPGHSAGISDAFFEAEACAKDVRKSPQKSKFRSSWTQCIDKFQAVYRKDTRGPWAPASLYSSGTLYLDLAKNSGNESDRKAAVEQFDRLGQRVGGVQGLDRPHAEALVRPQDVADAQHQRPARGRVDPAVARHGVT